MQHYLREGCLLLCLDLAESITENGDSHKYVDENADNAAIAVFLKQSKVSGMDSDFRTQFSAVFIVRRTNRFSVRQLVSRHLFPAGRVASVVETSAC
jgi:predicted RNA-binding Zn ribbon-like protein